MCWRLKANSRRLAEEYGHGLEIVKEVNDLRTEGVILGQLGTLALQEGDLADAVKRYHEALKLFQRLGEPASEAVIQHQLGLAFQEARQWEQAEQHYRESASFERATREPRRVPGNLE